MPGCFRRRRQTQIRTQVTTPEMIKTRTTVTTMITITFSVSHSELGPLHLPFEPQQPLPQSSLTEHVTFTQLSWQRMDKSSSFPQHCLSHTSPVIRFSHLLDSTNKTAARRTKTRNTSLLIADLRRKADRFFETRSILKSPQKKWKCS